MGQEEKINTELSRERTGLSHQRTELSQERTELSHERTELAIERTVMAANRNQMAWVRTSLSLISFGFTIYKFLQVEIARAEHLKIIQVQGPKRIGLVLISIGTMAMILGTLEYFQTIRYLNSLSRKPRKILNFSTFIGLMIGLLGLFLLVTIIANAEIF